jgi:hypothetical protein
MSRGIICRLLRRRGGQPGTPAGTYTVTLKAADTQANLCHSTTVTLTVTPWGRPLWAPSGGHKARPYIRQAVGGRVWRPTDRPYVMRKIFAAREAGAPKRGCWKGSRRGKTTHPRTAGVCRF